jgi:dCMP deaminase
MRPLLTETYLEIAEVWAKRSTCSQRITVGAVIVNDRDQVISSGYNGAVHGDPHCDDVGCVMDSDGHCTTSIHAEENAILQCAQNGVSTIGCSLYVTRSPCLRCAQRIVQVGILRVYYSTAYKNISEVIAYFKAHEIYIAHVTASSGAK